MELKLEIPGKEDLKTICGLSRIHSDVVWEEKEVASMIEDKAGFHIFVARWEGEIIGFSIGRYAWNKLHILDVVVSQDHRQRGIGRNLLEELIEDAKEKQLIEVYLEVKASNTKAISLYERLGFQLRFKFWLGEEILAMYLPLRI